MKAFCMSTTTKRSLAGVDRLVGELAATPGDDTVDHRFRNIELVHVPPPSCLRLLFRRDDLGIEALPLLAFGHDLGRIQDVHLAAIQW